MSRGVCERVFLGGGISCVGVNKRGDERETDCTATDGLVGGSTVAHESAAPEAKRSTGRHSVGVEAD